MTVVRWIGALLVAGLCVLAHGNEAPILDTWPGASVRTLAEVPVQDGGRVKPLSTYARFELLQFSGRTSLKLEDGTRLSALEWLLDCLLAPDRAKTYPVFLIEHPDAMTAIGLESEEARGRFSYNDLEPGVMTLFSLAQEYAHMERNERSPVQEQLVNLAQNVHEFEQLTRYFQFARTAIPLGDSTLLRDMFGGGESVPVSQVIDHAPGLVQRLMGAQQGGAAVSESDRAAIAAMLRRVDEAAGDASALAVIPPARPSDEAWLTPLDAVSRAFEPAAESRPGSEGVVLLEALDTHKGDDQAFTAAAEKFRRYSTAIAEERGEYASVPLETSYYRAKPFFWGLIGYLAAFFIAAICWLAPRNRALWYALLAAVSVPFLLHVGGIAMRCIIRNRPPVSTLYETILFIGAVAVLVAIVMEVMHKRRIAGTMAAFLGAVSLFLANKYEAVEGVDTMPSLIAVLDTNFWLSTHVTTVTIGYAAGILAGAISHVYLLGKTFGFKKNDTNFYKHLTRMVYGVFCFGLLFSTLGTVLGGIWANDSWGRFWGWDPKENGALMIVLWELFVLHGRMGGFIREYGLHMCAVFGAIIVAFSWFGVNLLGVGLHSYGFTNGVYTALVTFYAFESVILLIGAIGWLRVTSQELLTNDTEEPTAPNKQPEGYVK